MTTPMKYNPGFLSPDELRRSFVVRHDDLANLVRIVRENTGSSVNQHVLVVGPRGMGKTTLVRRVALEIESDAELSRAWYPVLYAEESYFADTPGRFWREALLHIARQTRDDRWRAAYQDLQRERDEARLRERALAAILDFADSLGRRLVLVVENLNMLLEDLLDPADAWAIRHTLQNEKRLMLLATATTRSSGVKDADKALFDLFKIHTLLPLTEQDCRQFWASVSSTEILGARARQIQILTGGNPRLLAVVAAFGRELSFRDLMQEMLKLVDDHTDYFKSHLEAVPPTERKVYLALAEIWSPATAAEVDVQLQMGQGQVSALLSRLEERGMITVPPGRTKRPKRYQIAERLYNVYWLLRRHGEGAERVRALIAIMESFYTRRRLPNIVKAVAEEACALSDKERQWHLTAYEEFVRRAADGRDRLRILASTPEEFWKLPDLTPALRAIESEAKAAKTKREEEQVHRTFRRIADENPNDARAWLMLGISYKRLDDLANAKTSLHRAVELDPSLALGWEGLASIALRENDDTAAYEFLASAAKSAPDDAVIWTVFGQAAIKIERTAIAIETLSRAVELDPKLADAWIALGMAYVIQRDDQKAEAAMRKATTCAPEDGFCWEALASVLMQIDTRRDEAAGLFRQALALNPNSTPAKTQLAKLLLKSPEGVAEATQLLIPIVNAGPDNRDAVIALAEALFRTKGQEQQGIALIDRWAANHPSDIRFRDLAIQTIANTGSRDAFPTALRLAREADKASPSVDMRILTSLLLIAVGKHEEAANSFVAIFELQSGFAEHQAQLLLVLTQACRTTPLLAKLLAAIEASPFASKLETVVATLKLALNLEVNAPAEVMEVARDIAREIRDRMGSEPAPS